MIEKILKRMCLRCNKQFGCTETITSEGKQTIFQSECETCDLFEVMETTCPIINGQLAETHGFCDKCCKAKLEEIQNFKKEV